MPTYFKEKEPPIISYTYTKTIASKIFNFSSTLSDLDYHCTIQEKKPNVNFIVSGLLPRDQETSSRRDKIKLVNQKLREWCRSGRVRNVYYLKPDKDWTEPDGRLVERYYFTDFLHLVEEGYDKFAKSIYEAIVNVSQGNVVDLVKDRKRSRSKSGSATPPPKTQQKQNEQTT